MRTFYVYQLYIEGDSLPFYIGKGKNRRYKHHSYQRDNIPKQGDHKNNKIKKAFREGKKIIHKIIRSHLTEIEAHDLERDLIRQYGRIDNGTGILTNKTDGGEGISGYRFSPSSRLKMSMSAIGKRKSTLHSKNISIGMKEWNSIEENKNMRLRAVRKACSTKEHSMKMKAVAAERNSNPDVLEKYRISKIGDSNPMYGMKPWNHPNTNIHYSIMWYNAELFYKLYSDTGKCRGFKEIKRSLGIEHVSHNNLAKWLKNGWNPLEDKEWNEWKITKN